MGNRKIRCRLDYWIVFKGVAKSMNKAEIIVFPHCDHHTIILEINDHNENFRTWIKVMYKNISSCVINNSFSSPFFTLQRGVRQGCPLSGLLFIIAVELLTISIRSSDVIRGIQVSNEIKLSQYADDTTVFCRDRHLLKELLELADLFQNCSGLKINYSKSEALWLGRMRIVQTCLMALSGPKIRYVL